ncbi:hypothetical protein FGIG_00694 [Fasciola gigantica]|uniref:Uncharacterized protein n=1 Tax=Fasciola gigantica TaxID=46835 RepID=A0A504Y4K9_FASGI|nr:hypothetical protein FGIG_00694 [Fasciola gigantica]
MLFFCPAQMVCKFAVYCFVPRPILINRRRRTKASPYDHPAERPEIAQNRSERENPPRVFPNDFCPSRLILLSKIFCVSPCIH